MAKSGLDYFYLSCSPNDRIQLIEAEFGITGFAIVVKLFTKIYEGCGYYCEWNDEVALLFSRKACGLAQGDNVVSEVVNAALKRSLFSSELFEKYGILTSPGIQKRFFEAAKRRTEVEVNEDYLLFDVSKMKNIVYIKQKNVCNFSKNVCKNQQRKVKESKGNIKPIGSKQKIVYFEDEELNQSFIKFIEMRKEDKKHAFTDHAIELAKEKLIKLASMNGMLDVKLAKAIAEQTIFHGWKGLFELKEGSAVENKKPINKIRFKQFNERDYNEDSCKNLERQLFEKNKEVETPSAAKRN